MNIKTIILMALALGQCLCAQQVITYEQIIDRRTVVFGALGVPLGSVFEVEGVLEMARDTKGMLYNAACLFCVEKVNGSLLSKPVRMWFHVKNPSVRMPEDILEMALWKKEQFGRELTEIEKNGLPAEFSGKRYRLVVFERGYFDGVPRNLPEDSVVWSGSEYGFETSLVVLCQAKENIGNGQNRTGDK